MIIKYNLLDMKKLAKKNKGICLSKEYFSVAKKLKWKCKEGHIWSSIAWSVITGSWCKKCSSKRVIAKLASLKRIPDIEDMEKLYLADKNSLREISLMTGYSQTAIKNQLVRKNIKLRRPGTINWNYNNIPTKEILSVLVGTLLGDGFLPKAKYHRILVIEHSEKQRKYLEWKFEKLDVFGGRIYSRKRFDKRTGNQYESSILMSKSHSILDSLYKKIYKNGNKVVTKELLDMLTEEGIAVWYCDDGNLKMDNGNNCLTLSTQSFDIKSLNIIKTMFKNRYQIDFKITKYDTMVLTNKKNIKKFIDFFGKYIPKCMSYKKEDFYG